MVQERKTKVQALYNNNTNTEGGPKEGGVLIQIHKVPMHAKHCTSAYTSEIYPFL